MVLQTNKPLQQSKQYILKYCLLFVHLLLKLLQTVFFNLQTMYYQYAAYHVSFHILSDVCYIFSKNYIRFNCCVPIALFDHERANIENF